MAYANEINVLAMVHSAPGTRQSSSNQETVISNVRTMLEKSTPRHYLFASDFDQTLSFNDSVYALSELIGIPVQEF